MDQFFEHGEASVAVHGSVVRQYQFGVEYMLANTLKSPG